MTAAQDIEIRTPHGPMPAYVARPATVPPPWPGVVVIHDFTGMSHDLRAQADWLASEGFFAVAPDLYYWGSRLGCLRTIMRDLGVRRGRSFDDIDAARRWLISHDGCTGMVGVIGFCRAGLRVGARGGPRLRQFQRQLRRLPLRRRAVAAAGVPDRRQLRRRRPVPAGAQGGPAPGPAADRLRGAARRQDLPRRRARLHERPRPRRPDPHAQVPGPHRASSATAPGPVSACVCLVGVCSGCSGCSGFWR